MDVEICSTGKGVDEEEGLGSEHAKSTTEDKENETKIANVKDDKETSTNEEVQPSVNLNLYCTPKRYFSDGLYRR